MTAMTFESVVGTPRRTAVRRNYHVAPRAGSTVVPPVAIAVSPADAKRSRDLVGLLAGVGIVVALHVAVINVIDRPSEIAAMPHKATVLTIDIAPVPPPPPPPVIKPKPLPQVAAAKPIVRQPAPSVPVVQSVSDVATPSAETVQVAVAASPVPPPAPVPEPVTEPHGYAGYLNNPAPVYPLAAQKHGLQGKVILKIHVLTNGQPDNVSVAKSSGFAVLDEAAVKAVSAWVFEPARRGKTAIDGWVNVPINFNLS